MVDLRMDVLSIQKRILRVDIRLDSTIENHMSPYRSYVIVTHYIVGGIYITTLTTLSK